MRVTCERKVWQRFNLIDAFQNNPKNKGYLPKTSVTAFTIQTDERGAFNGALILAF